MIRPGQDYWGLKWQWSVRNKEKANAIPEKRYDQQQHGKTTARGPALQQHPNQPDQGARVIR